MRTFGIVVFFIIISIIATVAIQSCETFGGVAKKTLDPDNVIYNYEYFKNQYNDIKALRTKYKAARQNADDYLKTAGPHDKWEHGVMNEYNRLNSIATGTFYQLTDAIADYNSKASMANRNIFKDSHLPDTIEE